jgi:pSer/pThr/pTyr-binding forkhead associated (FHA) protein
MNTTENNDLFLNIESLPGEVQNVLYKFSTKDNTYANCKKLEVRLFKHGYTFDFGLDAIPFNLRKIDENAKIKEAQNNVLNNVLKEAHKNKMQFHQISEVHAKALLNNDKKVFGSVNGFIEEITNVEQAELFYID